MIEEWEQRQGEQRAWQGEQESYTMNQNCPVQVGVVRCQVYPLNPRTVMVTPLQQPLPLDKPPGTLGHCLPLPLLPMHQHAHSPWLLCQLPSTSVQWSHLSNHLDWTLQRERQGSLGSGHPANRYSMGQGQGVKDGCRMASLALLKLGCFFKAVCECSTPTLDINAVCLAHFVAA